MRNILFIVLFLIMTNNVYADNQDNPPVGYQGSIAERPKLERGDRWEYLIQGQNLSHEFIEEKDGQLLFQKQENGIQTMELYTLDLNFVKEFDEKGDIEVVTPYRGAMSFPLWIGKKWRYMYSTRDKHGNLSDYDVFVKVEGYEKINVSAGTFQVFKIEEDREKRSNKKSKITFGHHRTVWYSPEIKHVIKSEEYNVANNKELIKYSLKNTK